MSNRIGDMGMDVQINRRLNSKYDSESEREVIDWLNQITGEHVPLGMQNVQQALRNGQILIKLVNKVYEGTAKKTPQALKIRCPLKFNTMSAPFKQMENIQLFLKAAEAYGVPRASLFQTVDLYESRNMAQVLNTLLQLGTECQRYEFNGPTCGPKPTYENKREFSEEQLRSSQGIIGLQAGSNKGASQAGMSMGATRHIADMKIPEMSDEAKGIVGLQAGSNKGASQAGMRIGTQRFINDVQTGLEMSDEGKSVIGLQAGSNKGASQAGMRIGTQRFINDVQTGVEMSDEGKSTIGMQMGPGMNQVDSQSGMSYGSIRHITDSH